MRLIRQRTNKLTSGGMVATSFWKAKEFVNCTDVEKAPLLAV